MLYPQDDDTLSASDSDSDSQGQSYAYKKSKRDLKFYCQNGPLVYCPLTNDHYERPSDGPDLDGNYYPQQNCDGDWTSDPELDDDSDPDPDGELQPDPDNERRPDPDVERHSDPDDERQRDLLDDERRLDPDGERRPDPDGGERRPDPNNTISRQAAARMGKSKTIDSDYEGTPKRIKLTPGIEQSSDMDENRAVESTSSSGNMVRKF